QASASRRISRARVGEFGIGLAWELLCIEEARESTRPGPPPPPASLLILRLSGTKPQRQPQQQQAKQQGQNSENCELGRIHDQPGRLPQNLRATRPWQRRQHHRPALWKVY